MAIEQIVDLTRPENPIDKLNAYVNHDHTSVDGWFSQPDMVLMACAGLAQLELAVPGDLCEIGVYHGKSLILLSHLLRDQERMLGFDYFEGDTLGQTERNVARLASRPERVILHRCNTLDLDRRALEQVIDGPARLRFLHVDGGHEYFEVLHDLMLFAPFLRDDAIIALDDYHDREYPGVNLAMQHFCGLEHASSGFVPFIEGHNKLFLCRRHCTYPYQALLVRMPVLADGMRVTQCPGHCVLVPFSRYPMPVEDMERAIAQPASFVLTPYTPLEEINRLAKARGSDEMVKSMTRAGKATKDFL